MRALSRLPLLSLAYALGQDPLTAGDQAANDRLRESEYNELCANPSDAEVQLGTWGKMLMYPQKQPAANTGLPLNPAGTVRDTIEDCAELCH
ncbi:hypothetical protein BDV39DRAFT_199074 [Aspergillus sergii]|uniref:Uncharacterized protein n=1 Tax=Aspergillus sergii TaxID=1034303 RepID=A0A5N6XJB7_9EURO|nr:hypothetical protein BDV39DRAFT_199074 [Aspergillus sergii]